MTKEDTLGEITPEMVERFQRDPVEGNRMFFKSHLIAILKAKASKIQSKEDAAQTLKAVGLQRVVGSKRRFMQ